jgi:hypothetical protein
MEHVVAEEVRLESNSSNGEKMTLSLRDKSVSLFTRNLPFVLMILGVFVGGLLIAKILFLGQTTGLQQLDATKALINSKHENTLKELGDVKDALQLLLLNEFSGQREQVRALSESIDSQTKEIRGELHEQNQLSRQENKEVLDRLHANNLRVTQEHAVINANIKRAPDNQLPLAVPVPREEPAGQR